MVRLVKFLYCSDPPFSILVDKNLGGCYVNPVSPRIFTCAFCLHWDVLSIAFGPGVCLSVILHVSLSITICYLEFCKDELCLILHY